MIVCPKCRKAYLRINISLGGIIFNRKKTIIHFCPICTFRSKNIFSMSNQQYDFEIESREKELDELNFKNERRFNS